MGKKIQGRMGKILVTPRLYRHIYTILGRAGDATAVPSIATLPTFISPRFRGVSSKQLDTFDLVQGARRAKALHNRHGLHGLSFIPRV